MMNMTGQQECHCVTYKTKGTCNCFWKMNFILLGLTAVGFLIPFLMGNYSGSILFGGGGLVILSIISGGWIHQGTHVEGVQKRSWFLLAELALATLVGTALISSSARYFQNPSVSSNMFCSFSGVSTYLTLLVILTGLSGLARWRPNNPKPWMDWGVPVGLIVLVGVFTWYFFNLLAPSMKASCTWVIASFVGMGLVKFLMDLLPPNVKSLIYKEWLEQRWILALCVVLEFIFHIRQQFSFLGLAVPVIILLYNGARMMAGEADHKTMDYLISKPLSLTQIFWSKFVVGVFPALYLLFWCAFLFDRVARFGITFGYSRELFEASFIITTSVILVYCFASFWSVLFRDTIRSILGIIIGGVLLGASYEFLVFNQPFSLLDMLFSLNIVSVLNVFIQLLGVTFLAIGIVGFLFLWKLRKRCLWKSSFTVLIGTGFCLLLFTPFVVIGPRAAVTRHSGDTVYYPLSEVEIRGDKIFYQEGMQTLRIRKLESDKTETSFEVNLRSKPDTYSEENISNPFIYGEDSFITLETASSGVYVSQLILDTYDRATVREDDSMTTLTSRVLKEVKLPPVKDLAYAKLLADKDNCYIQYIFNTYRKNPNYKKAVTHKLISGFDMAYEFGDEDPSVSIITTHFVKDVYVLGKDDLSIKDHYIMDTAKEFHTTPLIQNRYFLQISDSSENKTSIIDTFAKESSKELIVNTLPYKVRSYCLDSSGRVYIQTPEHLLAVMDVKDIRNVKILGTIPLSFRDKLSLNKFDEFNYLQKGNWLIFWNTTNCYVADISHPDKPVLLFHRVVPRKLNLSEQKLCWDPKMNSFRSIARGVNGYLYVGDYPPITK